MTEKRKVNMSEIYYVRSLTGRTRSNIIMDELLHQRTSLKSENTRKKEKNLVVCIFTLSFIYLVFFFNFHIIFYIIKDNITISTTIQ